MTAMEGPGKDKRDETGIFQRILRYYAGLRRSFGIPEHGHLHLNGKRKIWYVFLYRKMEEISGMEDEEAERIRCFWSFMNGDVRYRAYFYGLYLRAIRQVLWITKNIGSFEITAVPKADPEKESILSDVCREIAGKERFILSQAVDGTDILVRTKKMDPVHKGARHTVYEIEKSIECTRKIKFGTVILIDDLVYSGRTIEACRRKLRLAGAERIYSVCMYGYRRDKHNS